jgi:hypothetical protein
LFINISLYIRIYTYFSLFPLLRVQLLLVDGGSAPAYVLPELLLPRFKASHSYLSRFYMSAFRPIITIILRVSPYIYIYAFKLIHIYVHTYMNLIWPILMYMHDYIHYTRSLPFTQFLLIFNLPYYEYFPPSSSFLRYIISTTYDTPHDITLDFITLYSNTLA